MNRKLAGWVALIAAAALCVAPRAARAQDNALGIGDPAPKIDVKTFVKGEPVTEFQKDKLYVVEFWATWCGPCRMSIPHLTELQKKYPTVTFIGVSVWEQDQAGVAPFVKQMGEKMDYRVAMDSIPAGGDGQTGAMAKNWMKAAGQDGIPTAFVIDGTGKIAWIGHPMEMEKPLAAIVAGKWDAQAAIEQGRKDRAKRQELMEVVQKLQAAQATGDPKALLKVLDEAIQQHPDLEEQFGVPKFELLLQSGATAAATTYGQHLVDEVYKDSSAALNQIARSLVDPAGKKPQPAVGAFALKAAQQADVAAAHKDAAVADTLARAFFVNHQAAKAVAAQERAVRLAKGTDLEKDPNLKKCLAMYRAAVAAAAAGK